MHPLVSFIWNFYPYTMLIPDPFRELLNAPFTLFRLPVLPAEFIWNFQIESVFMFVMFGIAGLLISTDKNKYGKNSNEISIVLIILFSLMCVYGLLSFQTFCFWAISFGLIMTAYMIFWYEDDPLERLFTPNMI